MIEKFVRTSSLLGQENFLKLKRKTVAIFGLGGVGGYVSESLARSGVENFLLVDDDKVSLSNFNRQIISTCDNLEKDKAIAVKERILSINPGANVAAKTIYFDKTTLEEFSFDWDYVADCIDSITSKILLIEKCFEHEIPIISALGTGNKWDITQLEVSTIAKTSVCPLARVLRRELKMRNITTLKVVFSKEEPSKPEIDFSQENLRKHTPASAIFVPAACGLLMGKEILFALCRGNEPHKAQD